MLTSIRGGIGGFFAYIMLGLLVLSFVVWGIGDMLRAHGGKNVVASIGEEEITLQHFDQSYRQAVDRARQVIGTKATPELLGQAGLPQQVLQQLVTTSLVRQEVAELGLLPDDKTVAVEIRKTPYFLNKQDQFDKTLFEETLRRNGLREADYVDDIRRNMGATLLMSSIASAAPLNTAMLDALYAAERETRTADIIILSAERLPLPAAPDEAELEKFYETNTSLFMQPEYRTLSYLEIDKEKLGTEEDSEKALADLSNRIQDALAGGSTLEEVAKSLNLPYHVVESVDHTGNTPSGTPAKLPAWEDFLTIGFGLGEGEQSALLLVNDHYFIIQADKVEAAKPQPFDAVQEKLAKAWQMRERQKTVRMQADAMVQKLSEAKDAEARNAVFTEYNVQPVASGPLKRTATEMAGGRTLPNDLVSAIFTAKLGGVTPAFAFKDDYLLAIVQDRTAGKTPSAAERDYFRDKMNGTGREELVAAYLDYLRSKYPVRVYQDMLNAYTSPGE